MKTDLSTIRKPHTTYKVSKDEFEQFALLLNHGLDVDAAIELCFKDPSSIQDQLKKGTALLDILSTDSSFYFQCVKRLTQFVSLKDAIECTNQLNDVTKKLKSDAMKQLVYPIGLFMFSFFMILFFSQSIVPAMSIYTQDSMWMVTFLQTVYVCMFVIALGFVGYICFGYWYRPQLLVKFHLWQMILSYELSLFLRQFLHAGMHTMQMVEALQSLSIHKGMQVWIDNIYQQMLKGSRFEQALSKCERIDPTLIQYIKTGIHTSNIEQLLEAYERVTYTRITLYVKRKANLIQLISYVCVAIVVILFYQIMMLPLNMLNTF